MRQKYTVATQLIPKSPYGFLDVLAGAWTTHAQRLYFKSRMVRLRWKAVINNLPSALCIRLIRLRVLLILIVIVLLSKILLGITGTEKEMDMKKEDNKIEAMMQKSDRSFFGLHIDVRDIVNKKIMKDASITADDVGVVNPHPYIYMNNPGHCHFKSDNSRTILIIVKSTVRNVLLRQSIRITWGNITDESVKVVFMLGRNSSENFQQDVINTEAARHKDIVQEDFLDAYFNNTLKSIMSFNWAVQYCEEATFLLFLDDDFLIDFPRIRKYIDSIPEADMATLFMGHRIVQPVVRDQKSIWFLPWEVFPFKYWPPYLAGGAYLTSMDVARKFSYAFPYIDILGIDDAWLGVVARNLRINPQDNHFFHNNGKYSHLALVQQCCHTQKQLLETWWQFRHTDFRFGAP
ncbi:beta-1,3-galactosyltransferase brn-like isoform X1 [Argopecten irradians]|uniref:beta-1,3-galactosyltransferase brn-like isoform X1 n=1 Tax=Argopecten irradians TaxID=31199 RepID=UPI003718042F